MIVRKCCIYPAPPTEMQTTVRRAGAFMVRKALQQADVGGTQAAARNLRKQGVPLELALAILVGKSC